VCGIHFIHFSVPLTEAVLFAWFGICCQMDIIYDSLCAF